MFVLGIDVAKSDFHCSLIDASGKPRSNSFPNSALGFERLRRWLDNRKVDRVHACLEATGGWSEELALCLQERGHVVSLVNPMAIKAFGKSELSRTKTDKADAALIARFCLALKPEAWTPPPAPQRRLQRLVRRRAALEEMRVQEHNRLQGPGVEDVRTSLERTIAFLERQIAAIDEEIACLFDDDPTLRERRDLLETIPGIGTRLSATLLGEIPNITEFHNDKAVAAFAGLCPQESRSGSSISKSWLSKLGNARVRRALYMPALVAIRFNPVLSAWATGLRARGKRPKQIIAAVMRRLLVLAYGVLKSGRPFDPAFAVDARNGI